MPYQGEPAGRWCVDLRVVDNDGKPVQVGEVGEIICQSPLATLVITKNLKPSTRRVPRRGFATGDPLFR
jgi:non-ribosomal peptide synthetase component E (peptide arylation enzyme)